MTYPVAIPSRRWLGPGCAQSNPCLEPAQLQRALCGWTRAIRGRWPFSNKGVVYGVAPSGFSGDFQAGYEPKPRSHREMTSERVNQPLGRIAELLVEDHAKVSLNEIRDLFEAVDARAYAEGFEVGQPGTDDRLGSLAVRPKSSKPTRDLVQEGCTTLGWVQREIDPHRK